MMAAGCTGLDALNPVCQVGGLVGGLGSTVAGAGIDAVLNGLSSWVASGAEWLLGQIGAVLVATTTVDLGADWFRHNYAIMTALAGVVVLPLLLVSTLQAIYRQNPGHLVRAFLVQLPLALLLGVVAIQVVILCLSATDAMCSAVAGGASSSVSSMLGSLSAGLVQSASNPQVATFVVLLVGLLVAIASFVLWLELLVRAAAVYVAALFLPLALVTLVWPSVAHWCRRLVETLAALILSKFVIVATLSLAAGAVSSGSAGSGDHGAGFASILAGGALLVLATFVPFAILRLIPMVEAGAIGHLEGARSRGTAALTRAPKSAAAFALNEGMESLGASRLLAQAGPVGTGGAGGSGTGGSGGGDVPVGDEWLDLVNQENGGLVAGPNGTAIGLPGSLDDAVAAKMRSQARGRGPKPVMNRGAEAGGAAAPAPAIVDDEVLPADFKGWLGHPEPGYQRYYLGSDEIGGVIKFLPAVGEKPDPGPMPPSPPLSWNTDW